MEKLYLNDTYRFNCSAIICDISEDKNGIYVLLDRTVFYPQGGGQKSDRGVILGMMGELNVCNVLSVDQEIRHYISEPVSHSFIGSDVQCRIDASLRLLHARYHTAGHLIGSVVEKICPKLKPVKGHCYPLEAYIECTCFEMYDFSILLKDLQQILDGFIRENHPIKFFEIECDLFEKKFYKIPYSIDLNKKFRAVQIGEMLPVPCGGTHLSSTADLGIVKIKKIKRRNDVLKISFEVG